MEFVDMEHTPKNIMIRSVKTGKKDKGKKRRELERIIEEYHIKPTLYELVFGKK